MRGGFETENKTEINARTMDRSADGRKTDMTKTNIAPAMKMAGNWGLLLKKHLENIFLNYKIHVIYINFKCTQKTIILVFCISNYYHKLQFLFSFQV